MRLLTWQLGVAATRSQNGGGNVDRNGWETKQPSETRTSVSLSQTITSEIMADSASESDTDGAGSSLATPQCSSSSPSSIKQPGIVISPFRLEELTNRLASLQQENKVLKIELETFKLKCKALQQENRDLRKASVTIVSPDVFHVRSGFVHICFWEIRDLRVWIWCFARRVRRRGAFSRLDG